MRRFSRSPSLPGQRPRALCLLIMALALLAVTDLHAAGTLSMRSRVEVTVESVRVSDLFSGPLPSALQRLKKRVIFNAPMPGKEHSVPGAFLVRKIHLLQGCSTLEINAPSRVRISRTGQVISMDRLIPYLDRAAERTWKEPITLTKVRVIGRRTMPGGAITFTPDTKRLRIRKNRMELPLAVFVDKKPAGRLTLTATALAMREVVVTTKAVRQGDALTPGQVTLKSRAVAPSNLGVILDPSRAMGRMATRPIPPDTVLTAKMLKTPPLVKRGEGVRIAYTSGNMLISATGIAKEAGGMGDFINVKNSRSGKRITCRIIGVRRVEPLL